MLKNRLTFSDYVPAMTRHSPTVQCWVDSVVDVELNSARIDYSIKIFTTKVYPYTVRVSIFLMAVNT